MRYRIGEAVARTGVTARALYFYEEQRLIAPGRTSGGFRVYSEEHLKRVRLIKRLQLLGLRLDEMKFIVAPEERHAGGLTPGGGVDPTTARSRAEALLAALRSLIVVVDGNVEELGNLRADLSMRVEHMSRYCAQLEGGGTEPRARLKRNLAGADRGAQQSIGAAT